jgi:hypothetical protein
VPVRDAQNQELKRNTKGHPNLLKTKTGKIFHGAPNRGYLPTYKQASALDCSNIRTITQYVQ